MNRRTYKVRWISKARRDSLRRSGDLRGAIMLDSLKGFLIVEPPGSKLGDGEFLASEEIDYELRSAWCRDPRRTIDEARRLAGLEAEAVNPELITVG